MNFTKVLVTLVLIPTLALGTIGCETAKKHKTATGATVGALAGAAAGAAIGHQSGNRTEGALIGAAAGAAMGGGIGYYLSRQEKEFDKIEDVDVDSYEAEPATATEPAQPAHLTLRLDDQVLFEKGSAALTAQGTQKIAEVAQVLREYPESEVIVKGYTSSEGDEQYNLQLSRDRAAVVADTLVANKVNPARITAIGLGESNPIASNETEAGRAMNRRVEIEVFPTEEVR